LRRLMKAVAWCYCQLSVTRHHAPPTVTRNLSTISKCWNRRKVRVSSITEWRGCHIVVAQPLHSDQRLELQFPVRNRAPPGQCISSPAAFLFATPAIHCRTRPRLEVSDVDRCRCADWGFRGRLWPSRLDVDQTEASHEKSSRRLSISGST
jgi:hypothetical protein